jgi:RimJ/RimL family protein N-acetyltransferase
VTAPASSSTPGSAAPLPVADCGVVRIRWKTREDALDDFQWRRDPEMSRFNGSLPLTATFSQFLERLEYDLTFPSPDRQILAIESPSGEHVGNIMWYNAAPDRSRAEFGIGIGRPDWRGCGAGTAATIGFLRHIWGTTPFREIYLHTLSWNERAIACFRRAGFSEMVRLQRHGEEFVRMEVRREWWLLWDQEGRFDSLCPEPKAEEGERP